MAEAKTAFIGGSGLYRMPGLGDAEEVRVTTPFGAPSDTILVGVLEGKKAAFLPRAHTVADTDTGQGQYLRVEDAGRRAHRVH